MISSAIPIGYLCTLGLLYLACFGLFQAAPQRATIDLLMTNRVARLRTKVAACLLLLLSFLLILQLQTVARAIPTWLGMLSLMGGLNLLTAAMMPAQHSRSALMAALVSLSSGVWLSLKALI
ncbi:MAG: hypothetical protein PVF65_09520 [Sphingomonadales bacterium]|jgi:hypothetical protein